MAVDGRRCPRRPFPPPTPRVQAQLDEENSALKLRLEGQRRAIHELEHQAYTLRDDVRLK